MNKKFLIIFIIGIIFFFGGFFFFLNYNDPFILKKEDVVLRIGGSTTIYDYAQSVINLFTDNHQEVIITLSQSSSGEGIKRLLSGEIDIANASRLPKPAEIEAFKKKGKVLKMQHIGHDAVGVIVHHSKSKYVSKLTIDQVKAIFFEGSIRDWSQINSHLSGKINVYVRGAEDSGTASLFAEVISGSSATPYIKESIEVHITPLVIQAMEDDPNGIAYTPMKWINKSVSLVAIGKDLEHATVPSIENLKNDKYFLSRKLWMLTLSDSKNNLEKEFLEFVKSLQGQELLEDEGFLKI